MLHHSHRNCFATIPASNHCFIAQKSTISGHTKAQNTMLSFAERIQEPRMQHERVVKSVNRVLRRMVEIIQSHQLISDSEGRPGVFRIHTSVALFGDDLLRENVVSQYPRLPWIQSHRFHQTHGCPFVPTGALWTKFSIITTIV